MNQCLPPDVSQASQWQAELRLGFANTSRGTVLKHASHKGPLYVQKPFYPEGRDLAHIYLLHPPGGMVSGDNLHIHVTTQTNAHALVTTPGAGRVYKARPDKALQRQQVELVAEPNSTIEWLPLETIIYPNAHTELTTDIHLAKGSSVIAWEVTCFGLPASNEPFNAGKVSQRLQIFREGRLQLRERLALDPEHDNFMNARAGLNDASVNGLMVAGPFNSDEFNTSDSTGNNLEKLLDALREQCSASSSLAAVSFNHHFIQVRVLGQCSEKARQLFTQCWHLIRPHLLDRQGCEPRIWAT